MDSPISVALVPFGDYSFHVDQNTKRIAESVTTAIEVAGTPVDQVASAIGVSSRTLDRRREGRGEFTATALVGIALVTDCDMKDLLPPMAVP